MNKKQVLEKVANNKISHKDGFNKLYRRRVSKARFIYLSIYLVNQNFINFFFMILFALPFPISFVKVVPKKVFEKYNITKKDFFEALSMAKGTSVEIMSKEANIFIYIV